MLYSETKRNLQLEIEHWTRNLNQLRSELTSLENEKRHLAKDGVELTRKLKELEERSDLPALKAKLRGEEDKLSGLNKEISILEEKIERDKVALAEMDSKERSIKTSKENLQSAEEAKNPTLSPSEHKEALARADEDLRKATASTRKLEEDLRQLKEELRNLQRKLKQSELEKDILEKDCSEVEAKLSEAAAIISNNKQLICDIERKIEDLPIENEEIKALIQSKRLDLACFED